MKKITKEWLLENGFTYEDGINDDKNWFLGRSFKKSYINELYILYASDFSVLISDNLNNINEGRCIIPSTSNLTHQEELIQFLNLLGYKL